MAEVGRRRAEPALSGDRRRRRALRRRAGDGARAPRADHHALHDRRRPGAPSAVRPRPAAPLPPRPAPRGRPARPLATAHPRRPPGRRRPRQPLRRGHLARPRRPRPPHPHPRLRLRPRLQRRGARPPPRPARPVRRLPRGLEVRHGRPSARPHPRDLRRRRHRPPHARTQGHDRPLRLVRRPPAAAQGRRRADRRAARGPAPGDRRAPRPRAPRRLLRAAQGQGRRWRPARRLPPRRQRRRARGALSGRHGRGAAQPRGRRLRPPPPGPRAARPHPHRGHGLRHPRPGDGHRLAARGRHRRRDRQPGRAQRRRGPARRARVLAGRPRAGGGGGGPRARRRAPALHLGPRRPALPERLCGTCARSAQEPPAFVVATPVSTAATLPLRAPGPARTALPWAATTVAAAALLGAAVVGAPGLHRWLLAGGITAVLLTVAARAPRAAIRLVLLYLPVVALLRRVLIADVPWTSQDPLLLVAPAVVAFLCVQRFVVERRPVVTDRTSLLLVLLAAIAVGQVANPLGGGLVVGTGGLLFLVVPIAWFLLGRTLGDRELVRQIMAGVVAMGLGIAVYGLYQTEVGFPSWDVDWMHSVTFAVLNVGTDSSGTALRAFGTFPSPSEYLYWLALTTVFCLVAWFERRSVLVLAMPLLLAALFLGSGRSMMVLTVLAVTTMAILWSFRGRQALLLILAGAAVTLGALIALGPYLAGAAAGSSNPLVAHQAGGLGNPLDESSSTLPTHLRAIRGGIEYGVRHPLGQGTGATNIAADSLGGSNGPLKNSVDHNGYTESLRGTDADVSNVFMGLGLAGGVVYVLALLGIGRALLRRWTRWRDPVLLGVIGCWVALFFEWLRGEQYAVAAVIWFLAGWATRSTGDPRAEAQAA